MVTWEEGTKRHYEKERTQDCNDGGMEEWGKTKIGRLYEEKWEEGGSRGLKKRRVKVFKKSLYNLNLTCYNRH